MTRKRVLIISFTFPPSPGIGGRRWAKFAKLLQRKGHLVKVLCADLPSVGSSAWTADTKEFAEDDIIRIPSEYPAILSARIVSLVDKLMYRLALVKVRMQSKGNYFDRSINWNKKFIESVRSTVVREKIDNIVCTVGPFQMASTLLSLRAEFPAVNFIVDYRDPWSNNMTSFGFTTISDKRLAVETSAEKQVLLQYDHITCVSEQMAEHFVSLAGREVREKITTISNGFDTEDLARMNTNVELPGGDDVKILFAGSFYTNAAHVFVRLAEAVRKCEKQNPDARRRLRFIFIGEIITEIAAYFNMPEPNFVYLGKKSLEDTYGYIKNADYCALFLTNDLDYSFSTKFYEYIALNKPVLSFSHNLGDNGRFIENEGIGYAVHSENLEERLIQLMSEEKPLVPELDKVIFDVRELVNKVDRILK